MARGFKRRGRKGSPDVRYAARLDMVERGLVLDLLQQTLDLLDPDGVVAQHDPDADEFDRLVASLGSDDLDEEEPFTVAGDPALERLFPTANRADDEAAQEFRRLTESSLRQRKVDNIYRSITALIPATPDDAAGDGRHHRGDDRVELTREQALALVVALTDVRLVLAERLGVRTEEEADRLHELAAESGEDNEITYAAAVYDFLAWLQQTLSDALMP